MLATLLFEVASAIYILWRYQLTTLTRLVVMILGCLAIFQGTEYMLCGGIGLDGGTWSRLGYSAITLLPPLGLHLAYTIAGRENKWLIRGAYVSAALFVTYFTFGINAISGHTCYANYVVFDGEHSGLSWAIYALYYYGWLFVGVWKAFRFASIYKKRVRSALLALAIGYLAFIIPTTAMNLVDRSTIAAIPSIMCGFAVVLAYALVMKVVPKSAAERITSLNFRLKLPF